MTVYIRRLIISHKLAFSDQDFAVSFALRYFLNNPQNLIHSFESSTPRAATLFMADHDFEKTTQVFLEWLERIGVKISPKMALADFRSQHRGRGAGNVHPS